MLRRIKLLVGMAGPLVAWGPGRVLEIGSEIDEPTAERMIASGAAAPVAVDRELPVAAEVRPPEVETEVVAAPEAAVAPSRKPPTKSKRRSR